LVAACAITAIVDPVEPSPDATLSGVETVALAPWDVATVLRVLYQVFNVGYSGDVGLAAEAIRLTRQLAAMTNHEEVAGLLALMLLHRAP
jgi:predicted RNA polymerase sigma factor